MQYVIKDLIGQIIDTLQAESTFEGVQIARHSGEVNPLMFTNTEWYGGLIKKLPFVFIKYQGRTAISRDSVGSTWIHELTFSLYVGAHSERHRDEATEEAEVYLAKIWDLLHGKKFYSNQTWVGPTALSGVKITTSGFNQQTPLLEAGGQDEKLIVTNPDITLYETKYTVRLLVGS
jgi:hypothetical protein